MTGIEKGIAMIAIRRVSLLLCCLCMAALAVMPGRARQVFVRVTLLEPADAPYKLQVMVHPSYSYNYCFFAGQTVTKAEKSLYVGVPGADVLQKLEAEVQPVAAGASTPWIDLSGYLDTSLASVQFFVVPAARFAKTPVRARFDVSATAGEEGIARSITEHDPGNVVALRIPKDLAGDRQWLLSIREDSVRRLNEVKAFKLPEGPLPRKLWFMTGFRSWNMYTDPAIAENDFQVIRAMGMNGFWDFTPEWWALGQKYGIDRTTLVWRAGATPPGFANPTKIVMDWKALETFIDGAKKADIDYSRKIFGGTLPPAIVDCMDEPAGVSFAGPEYDVEFAQYARERGLTPDFFGKKSWDEVKPVRTDWIYMWHKYFELQREALKADLYGRRLFYWSVYFYCVANARVYALGTEAINKYAPEVLGMRLNMGPPWWYDYGTIPRGMDAFELARQRGITMAFNEDWIGSGHPRWPLEINAFLADWDRAPFRPRTPLGGGFITRDANRSSVKLRVFGFLARDCKIFDFYYYGPSYGQFDHYSDNLPMVQGICELTREVGRADAILWEAHPPRAKVALLYPKSWTVWKQDDTEQIEQLMTYVALLHAGLPVDIVSDDEVADGRFAAGKYACLYVVHESVPAKAAAAIDKWVKAGGRLWTAGWGAAKDEYNTPSDVWNAMLGIRARSWQPAGDTKRLGELTNYADAYRPYFSRWCRLEPAAGVAISGATSLKQASAVVPEGEAPVKAYRRRYGRGLVQVVPWTAGKEYIDGATTVDGALAKAAIRYPADDRRAVIAGFAREAVQPPAITSVSQVQAWPLWSARQGAVLLANYTGNPADMVTVAFAAPFTVKSVASVYAGPLKFARRSGGRIEVKLPMNNVTEILIVNE